MHARVCLLFVCVCVCVYLSVCVNTHLVIAVAKRFFRLVFG